MQEIIKFKNNQGIILKGCIHNPSQFNTAIVFLHGFPGNFQYNVPLGLGMAMEKLGFLLLRFNFSGTDTSGGNFSDKLMSQEVEDVKYSIDFLCKNYHFKKLILMGHSTGAIDAALYAHKDERIDKLVLLGGVGNLKEAVRYDFTDQQVKDFWTKGHIVYKSKQKWLDGKKLKKAFYDEFFKLDVLGSLRKFKKPVLIIHGEKDEAVPVNKDPVELYEAANKPKKLCIIKGADHKFSKTRYLRKVVHSIANFIK